MGDIWITSDPHYDHKNIVEGESDWGPGHYKRPFQTRAQMNKIIVDNINAVAQKGDRLICLGDWNMGGMKNVEAFRSQLNCAHIDLIFGNHDGRHGSDYGNIVYKKCFEFVGFYKEEFIKDKFFVMFHYPINSWNHMGKGAIHAFGHTHKSPQERFFNGGKSMDVGVDGNNMKPYNIDEVISIMACRPSKSEGHH